MKKEPIIRVGILAAATVRFELKGEFLLQGKKVNSGLFTTSLKDGIIECSCNAITGSEIILTPLTPSSTFILKEVTIGIGFHWERKEDQEFEGGLTLLVEENLICAVNTVPLESYMKCVISSEMSAMSDINLLNAHAIVSRSWLLAQLQNRGKGHVATEGKSIPPREVQASHSFFSSGTINPCMEIIKWYDREDHRSFDVCADDHCQRYQGITKVITENAGKAIEATRGQVLMYEDEICDARFSKCCGGITEDFENVWQPVKVPYLVAVRDVEEKMFPRPVNFEKESFLISSPDAYCNTTDPAILNQVLVDFDKTTSNFYRWTVEYTQEELSLLIAKKSGIDFGHIMELLPLERGNSGRIIKLKIIGEKKEIIVGKELEIRKWLSESHLYSSAFIVEKISDLSQNNITKFILHGAGWGHGVGMCQIGAAVMSKKGYTQRQILEHYFKSARIEKIYE